MRLPNPPIPPMNGSTTPCTKAVAIAASIALPPARKTSAPIAAAAGCGATTIPFAVRPTDATLLFCCQRALRAGSHGLNRASSVPPMSDASGRPSLFLQLRRPSRARGKFCEITVDLGGDSIGGALCNLLPQLLRAQAGIAEKTVGRRILLDGQGRLERKRTQHVRGGAVGSAAL